MRTILVSIAIWSAPSTLLWGQDARRAGPQAATQCTGATVRAKALAASVGPAGRYGSGAHVFIVGPCGATLAAQPAVSADPALLVAVSADSFVLAERPERRVAFRRGADGSIDAMTLVGTNQWMPRLARSDTTLVDHILGGRVARAAAGVGRTGGLSLAAALDVANDIRNTLPSFRPRVVAFLAALVRRTHVPRSELLAAYIDALASTGATREAASEYAHAPLDDSTRRALGMRLRMAGAIADSDHATGWVVPFTLDRVFQPPTAAEQTAVEHDWTSRAVTPSRVDEVYRAPLVINDDTTNLAVLSFALGDTRQYGAVIRPRHPGSRCCAVVVDIRGTTPDYEPLDLGRPLRSVQALGTALDNVMILLPGVRGERIVIGDHSFESSGDRRDGWDGAADDARALLWAATQHYGIPATAAVCAFGHSRGGTVALLAAARDRRFGCVVAEAPPVDWFSLMSEAGWPLASVVREALHDRSTPGAAGGQFIERFLAPAVAGQWSADQVRHRMLASSPLYFVDRLPPTLAIFGDEDASVPVANGVALRDTAAAHARHSLDVHVEHGVGHDLDPVETPGLVGTFLRTHLHVTSRQE